MVLPFSFYWHLNLEFLFLIFYIFINTSGRIFLITLPSPSSIKSENFCSTVQTLSEKNPNPDLSYLLYKKNPSTTAAFPQQLNYQKAGSTQEPQRFAFHVKNHKSLPLTTLSFVPLGQEIRNTGKGPSRRMFVQAQSPGSGLTPPHAPFGQSCFSRKLFCSLVQVKRSFKVGQKRKKKKNIHKVLTSFKGELKTLSNAEKTP